MIINFNDISQVKVENMRNGEGYVLLNKFNDEQNSIVKITIPQNGSIGLHTHIGDQEIIYVISGKGFCLEDDIEYELETGKANYCAEGKNHSIRNPYKEELVLFAVITKK